MARPKSSQSCRPDFKGVKVFRLATSTAAAHLELSVTRVFDLVSIFLLPLASDLHLHRKRSAIKLLDHFKSFHQISNFLPFSSETARSATSHESQTLLPSSEPYGRNPTPSPQTPRTPTLRPVGVHQQLNSFNVKNRLPSPTSRRCVTE